MTTETPKTKQKHKLPLTAVLTYLIVVTLVATGVSLSAYVSTASGGDNTRVAKFEVNDNTLGQVQSLIVSENISPIATKVQIQVQNNSEVTVAHKVVVDNITNNMPSLVFYIDDTGNQITDNVTTTYQSTLAPDEVGTYDLFIKLNSTDPANGGKVEQIQITVIAEQLD